MYGKGVLTINNLKYSNSIIIDTLGLPKIYDINSFSTEIGLSPTILYLLSQKQDLFYKNTYIPKRDGSNRQISIPSISMKLVQKWIKVKILDKLYISGMSMAFRKGNSYGIKKNAELHRYDLYILKIDLTDFFHSIDRMRIFYLFKGIGYNNLISNILTNLCTYKERLPQGAVTSPVLSNLVCEKMDKRLSGVASKRGISYTRYADDMYFSCDDEILLRKTQSMIYEIIEDEEFKINNKKVKFMGPSSRKCITGLVINDSKVVVPREMKRKVRVMIHHAIATGDYSKVDSIKGYISFISSIEKDYENRIKKYCQSLIDKDQYKVFDDLIEKYNQNKFIDTNEMKQVDEDELLYEFEGIELNHIDSYIYERIEFYKKNNLENKMKDFYIENKEIACVLNEEIIMNSDDNNEDFGF
ncbi:RNA-directed DNA polymerase [Clostridium botulinum]|nr:RNA-directed DNA polymerase [Clostridium botulinum]